MWVTCGYSASPGLAPHPSRMQSSVAVRGWYGCTVFSFYFIYFGPQRPHPPKVKCSTVAPAKVNDTLAVACAAVFGRVAVPKITTIVYSPSARLRVGLCREPGKVRCYYAPPSGSPVVVSLRPFQPVAASSSSTCPITDGKCMCLTWSRYSTDRHRLCLTRRRRAMRRLWLRGWTRVHLAAWTRASQKARRC